MRSLSITTSIENIFIFEAIKTNTYSFICRKKYSQIYIKSIVYFNEGNQMQIFYEIQVKYESVKVFNTKNVNYISNLVGRLFEICCTFLTTVVKY